ncbi:hypothetical protein J5837_07550 [Pseudoxanthomonas helianthi]|uniref:Uncharacterized protein n=1 Tax=Pseudoxanthomonas helianthi TaxID=1453541 RepID=A0A940X394_9GAMM|nr:hypothetical protein [Pseudoxanthomonas helianthi]MBP3984281.1 hypothetical protein [Pseudoxanthomonas helianthi]
MISDKVLAEKISVRVLEVNRLLNEAVVLVAEEGSVDEMEEFRMAVGRVLGELILLIANPIYRKHPELQPEGLSHS